MVLEAGSIMNSSMVVAQRKNSVKDIVAKMAAKDIACAVVVEKKSPVGIFTEFELLPLLDSGADLSETTMEMAMETPFASIDEAKDFFTSIRMSGNRNSRQFVTVDSSSRLKGVITEEDIIGKFALRSFPFNMTLAPLQSNGTTVTPKTTVKAVIKSMVATRANFATVLQNRKPVGIIGFRQILQFTAKGAMKAEAAKKMAKKMALALDGTSARAAVINMMKMEQPVIVVTDEKGNYSGIVTGQALIRHIEKTQL